MPISDYLRASGILIHAGETGELYENVGRLTVSKAAIRGIDLHLWAVLKICADELKLWLNVNSIDTGRHVPKSRHYQGRAADVNQVTPIAASTGSPAVLTNPAALLLIDYLLAGGFYVGEYRPWPAVLFGPPKTRWNPSRVDHRTHLHCSLAPKPKGTT